MGNRRAHSPFYTPAKNGHAAIAKISRKLEVSRNAAADTPQRGDPLQSPIAPRIKAKSNHNPAFMTSFGATNAYHTLKTPQTRL